MSNQKYIQTGEKNQYRAVDNGNGTWSVEGTDNNGVWVETDHYTKHESLEAAEEAAEELAAMEK